MIVWDTSTSECKANVFLYEGLDAGVEPVYGTQTEVITTESVCCTTGKWLYYRSLELDIDLPGFVTAAQAEQLGRANMEACEDHQEEMIIDLDARTCAIQKFNLATISGHEGEHKFILETKDMDREDCCASDLTPASYLDITRPICYSVEENTPGLTTDFLLNTLRTTNPDVGSSATLRLEAESNLTDDIYTVEL